MAGELRLSQFRWTTTANDDFVIGSPEDYSSHNTKFLVFQTDATPGYASNPHIRCQWNSGTSSWNMVLNTTGSGSDINLSNIAYLDATLNAFTGLNTFASTTTTNGALITNGLLTVAGGLTANSNILANDALTVNGAFIASGTSALNGTTTSITNSVSTSIIGPNIILGTNTGDALTIHSAITALSSLALTGNLTTSGVVDFSALFLTLNHGGLASTAIGSGILLEEASVITGYFKTSADRNSWLLKSPNIASVVTLTPGGSSATLVLPASNGTLALLTDVVNQQMPAGYTKATGSIPAIATGDSITTVVEKLDGGLTEAFAAISSGTLWALTGSDIYYSSGRVSIGITSFVSGVSLLVAGGHTVNYGAGSIASNSSYGISLTANTTGSGNTAEGQSALNANTTGNNNTAVGYQALLTNISGNDNTAIGLEALTVSTGSSNVAIGSNCLLVNTTGGNNTGSGYRALYSNTTASNNSGFGSYSLYGNTTGTSNVGIGYYSLYTNTTGSSNTALGYNAGYNSSVSLTTLSQCTFVGATALASVNALTNSTAIGYGATITASNQIVLGNNSVTSIVANGSITATGASVTGTYVATLSSGGSYTPLANTYDTFVLTFTSGGTTTTINTPTGTLGVGQTMNFIFIQPGSGVVAAAPTWASSFKFFGPKNISSTLGGRSVVSCVWDGTYWLCTSAKDPS